MRRRRFIGVYRGFWKSMGMPWLLVKSPRPKMRLGTNPAAWRQPIRKGKPAQRFATFAQNPSISAAFPKTAGPRLRFPRRSPTSTLVARCAAEDDERAGTPMTTFDKREETFEKKYARDEELRFKANARRNKLLG